MKILGERLRGGGSNIRWEGAVFSRWHGCCPIDAPRARRKFEAVVGASTQAAERSLVADGRSAFWLRYTC